MDTDMGMDTDVGMGTDMHRGGHLDVQRLGALLRARQVDLRAEQRLRPLLEQRAPAVHTGYGSWGHGIMGYRVMAYEVMGYGVMSYGIWLTRGYGLWGYG